MQRAGGLDDEAEQRGAQAREGHPRRQPHALGQRDAHAGEDEQDQAEAMEARGDIDHRLQAVDVEEA